MILAEDVLPFGPLRISDAISGLLSQHGLGLLSAIERGRLSLVLLVRYIYRAESGTVL